MNFEFSADQDELRALTRKILEGHVTEELLRHIDAGENRFDPPTWKAMAESNLLGIALPEDLGGNGYGLIEQCIVLEEVGRVLAPVPVWASSVLGAPTLATFGNEELRRTWVPRAISGEAILTAALSEPASRSGDELKTIAEPADGGGWRLTGIKTRVAAGTIASAILVPARVEDSIGLFLVETTAPGLTVESQRTSAGDSDGRLEMDRVPVSPDSLIGSVESGPAILAWLRQRADLGICAMQLGLCTTALDLTVEYTKTRKQFGRPIATFQAVGHRAADCFIDLQAMGLTLWQAAYQLEVGIPAEAAVDTARFWASEGGQRIVHAAVHLHGGVGTDRDGPVHRYFLAGKDLEFALGGATEHLLALGDNLDPANRR